MTHFFFPVTTQKLPFGDDIKARIDAVLKDRQLSLCHIDWRPGARRGVLTLTIDREGGVTLDDCERATRAVEAILDEHDVPPTPYVLEVESPGLDRPLWTLDDCVRFAGRRVDVRLLVKVEGTGRLKGILERVDGEALTVLDEDRRRRYTVRFGDVKLARLVPEF